MPTFHQSIKNARSRTKKTSKPPASQKSPQKKAVRSRVYIRNPKKPNPAKRKATNLPLPGKARSKVIGYIPGEGHTLQEHSIAPIRGGRVKDLPGVKYHLIPGLFDFKNVKKRKQKRSKYGVALRSSKQTAGWSRGAEGHPPGSKPGGEAQDTT